MITADSIIKLNTSVVYVTTGLEDPGLLIGANPSVLNDIIDTPEPLPSPTGITLSSMRSQLTVDISANRLAFADRSGENPTRADFPGRVASVAEYVGRQSDQIYSAVGLNFEIEWEPDDERLPTKVLLGRIVNEEALMSTGYDIIGASAGLWYVAREVRHHLRVEPRGNQYDASNFYANLNVHMNLENQIPSAAWLSRALDEEYRDFIKVLGEVLTPRKGQMP